VIIKNASDDIKNALSGNEKDQWIDALKTEIDSHFNTTKSLIEEKPIRKEGIEYDIIYATAVLKKKLKADGTLDKYKVRNQLCGDQLLAKKDDNNPTYSPTISMLTHTAVL